jgi:hypothetical protein
MKHVAEMGSGAMIYIPSIIQICSGIEKIHRQHADLISLLLIFKIRKVS